MSSLYTSNEQQAYATLQARLIDVLMRHDQQRFRDLYQEHTGWQGASDLDIYRELAVLFMLRDQLFEHILPKIVRQLSFALPSTTQIEQPPVHGYIDWQQSLIASWQERPGEPPLQLHTRQRRRDFATPENLLTVATLLEYHNDIEELLQHAMFAPAAWQHPLNDIIERIQRELIFPQFAGIRQAAQTRIQQQTVLELEAEVAERVETESAYGELVQWRQRRRLLRLLEREQLDKLPTLGVDPQHDNKLYEWWIFYELLEFLQANHHLEAFSSTAHDHSITFRWGEADDQCSYTLVHDHSVPDPLSSWKTNTTARVPGVRPDFYLRRVAPQSAQVIHEQHLYWREPGLVWDAKYYRERAATSADSTPVKRMLSDLMLLGEPHGILLFAFLESQTSTNQQITYTLSVEPDHAQTMQGQPSITVQQLRPIITPDMAQVHSQLTRLLNSAHNRLKTPQIPRCEGIFLDSNSIPLSFQPAFDPVHTNELLLCPKAHIGPWRNDLVQRDLHCLQDPSVCHIINQVGASKPVRPPRNAEELLQELQNIMQTEGELSDEYIQHISQQVQDVTRKFAEIAGAYKRIDVYYKRLRDIGLDRTFDLIGAPERESLALAMFLVEQLDSIGANDYSAPGIHIGSVMEIELKRRVFATPNLVGKLSNPKSQTLGTLPYIKRNPWNAEGNWEIIENYASQHWNTNIDPEDPEASVSFEAFIDKALNHIAQLRNTAAHTEPLSRDDYTTFQRIVCQRSKLGEGALNILILAWQTQP